MLSHEPLETDAAWQWPGGDDGFFPPQPGAVWAAVTFAAAA